MTEKTVPFSLGTVNAIKSSYSTPFYIYDAAGIEKCVKDLYKAFSWNEGFKEYFAVKATPNPAILKLLASLGCGMDCASVAEVEMSRRCGIEGHNIMFSSNDTAPEDFRAANDAGAIINLDDITHISMLEKVCGVPDTVCCRYNPGTFLITNEIMGRLDDSKFGMTRVQLVQAMRILRGKGVKHFGVHAMLASSCLENVYYPHLAEELFGLALELRDTLGIELEFIDMSGGIGIPYLPEQTAVDIFSIGEGVREAYERLITPSGMKIKLFTEMGRYITGPYGYLVTTVLHHKDVYKHYVGVDATACDLMRPAMYGSYHHITVLGREDAECDTVCDVVGSLCENNDKFAVDRFLPRTQEGDVLVLHDAGAHGRSMGYNYNGKLRCGEFLLEKNGEVRLIHRAETVEDYFATLDIFPEFSKKG